MKWFWLITGILTSACSACPSEPRCAVTEADVFTPSPYVLAAENFLEGNKQEVKSGQFAFALRHFMYQLLLLSIQT